MHRYLSSATFAELIGVPRSSISHILSGRNKPSLEFVLKIEAAFEEVDLKWLIHGEGLFPKDGGNSLSTENTKSEIGNNEALESDTIVETKVNPQSLSAKTLKSNKKEIDKIVIFYKDQSFECFES